MRKNTIYVLIIACVVPAVLFLVAKGAISETLGASLIASILPLAGVLWVVERNYAQFLEGQRDDARKRIEKRAYAAKQDALIAAADVLTRFVQYLSVLPDRQIEPGGTVPREIEGAAAALAKLHFYCGIETIRKSMEINEAVTVGLLEVMKAKLAPMFLDGDIKGIDIQLNGLQAIVDRLNAEILAALRINPQDPQIPSWRRQSAETYEKMSGLNAQKAQLFVDKYRATEQCRDIMLPHLARLLGLQSELLVIARRELDFDIPEAEYDRLMKASTEKALAAFRKFADEIRAQFAAKLAPPPERLPNSGVPPPTPASQ